jgi:hypothetical protein
MVVMKVIRIHPELSRASAVLGLLPIIALLNAEVAFPGLSLKRAFIAFSPWILLVSVFSSSIWIGLRRGHFSALVILRIYFTFWILLNLFFSATRGHPKVAIFSILLAPSLLWILNVLYQGWSRPCFDSGVSWYQGYPRAIPEVTAHIKGLDQGIVSRVARLDRDGIFVFTSSLETPWANAFSMLENVIVELHFRDRTLQLSGLPVRCWGEERLGSQSQGLGLRFIGNSSDLKKQLGDWIEKLKGEGYVAE